MESTEQELMSIGKTIDNAKNDSSVPAEVNSPMVSVAFSSMFTLVTTFFTGILINNDNYFSYLKQCKCDPLSIDMPILLMIISTFGFLYATLIYANINGLLIKHEKRRALRGATLGNILSEYFGVYLVILSIPLIISIVSNNPLLNIVTIIVNSFGLVIYHLSGFSLMSRHFGEIEHFIYVVIIIVFELALFSEQHLVMTSNTLSKISINLIYFSTTIDLSLFALTTCLSIAFISYLAFKAYIDNEKKPYN